MIVNDPEILLREERTFVESQENNIPLERFYSLLEIFATVDKLHLSIEAPLP